MMKKFREQDVKLRELQCETHKTKKLTEEQEKQRVMDLLQHEQKMLDIKKRVLSEIDESRSGTENSLFGPYGTKISPAIAPENLQRTGMS